MFRLPRRLLCLVMLLHGALAMSRAATIHVPADQPTIQAGIDAAANGDTVLVAPGTYKENIDFKGKAITVISSGGTGKTIIQGDGTTAVVFFNSNETRTSTLKGFTIQGGGFVPGRPDGGGVFIKNGAPTILNNVIRDNSCHGITVYSGALIQGNTISGTVTGGSPFGDSSGDCFYPGSAVLVFGGGINPPTTLISNTIINNKYADTGGGGIMVWAAEHTVIESNVIANNATTAEGGGILAYNTEGMVIAQNLFYGNYAEQGGGAISFLIPRLIDIGQNNGLIENNTFAGNSVKNSSSEGGYSDASQVFLDGDLGLYEIRNNIIVGNDAQPAFVCGSSYLSLSDKPPVFDHNDIYNFDGPAYAGTCPDPDSQAGSLSDDPLFQDAANHNYHLQKGSPAIDSGNNGALDSLSNFNAPLVKDIDGNTRLQNATGKDSPIVDMGVYEYAGSHSTADSIKLVSSPNPSTVYQLVTFTATVTSANGTPDGTVEFLDGMESMGTIPVANSSAGIITGMLTTGQHTITAVWRAQGSALATSASITQTVSRNPTTTMMTTIVPNPAGAYLSTTLSAIVQSSTAPGHTPTGTVTFSTGGKTLGSAAVVNGTASAVINAGPAGTYPVIATYSGDAAFAPSASMPETLIVGQEISSVRLTSSLNPSVFGNAVTFAATASAQGTGIPLDGTFTFYDGAAQLGQAQSTTGTAAFTTSTLAVGTHPITVVYSGNASVQPSTSDTLQQVVLAYQGDFSLTVTPGSASLYTGEAARFTVTVAPQNGFNLPLALSCSGLPADATCTFTPASLQDGAYTSTLVVQTAAPKGTAAITAKRQGMAGGAAALASLLGLLLIPSRLRRRWVSGLWFGVALLAAFVSFSGCGGSGTLTGGTPVGTAQITVTANTTVVAPQLSHSAPIQLTVKSLF